MKTKDVIEKQPKEKPVVPLEEADKLFDNGYYEECYNLLSEHQVRLWCMDKPEKGFDKLCF